VRQEIKDKICKKNLYIVLALFEIIDHFGFVCYKSNLFNFDYFYRKDISISKYQIDSPSMYIHYEFNESNLML